MEAGTSVRRRFLGSFKSSKALDHVRTIPGFGISANVRFGSLAAAAADGHNVCFAPESSRGTRLGEKMTGLTGAAAGNLNSGQSVAASTGPLPGPAA
jgi:hypothetical protein